MQISSGKNLVSYFKILFDFINLSVENNKKAMKMESTVK